MRDHARASPASVARSGPSAGLPPVTATSSPPRERLSVTASGALRLVPTRARSLGQRQPRHQIGMQKPAVGDLGDRVAAARVKPGHRARLGAARGQRGAAARAGGEVWTAPIRACDVMRGERGRDHLGLPPRDKASEAC